MTIKKTIAQQLNVKEFPFIIKDKNGKEIYREDSDGYWAKYEYDANGNVIYDKFKDSDGFWIKRQYDEIGNQIYYEDSYGTIIDNRPKQREVTMDEIAKALNIDVKQLKIKK